MAILVPSIGDQPIVENGVVLRDELRISPHQELRNNVLIKHIPAANEKSRPDLGIDNVLKSSRRKCRPENVISNHPLILEDSKRTFGYAEPALFGDESVVYQEINPGSTQIVDLTNFSGLMLIVTIGTLLLELLDSDDICAYRLLANSYMGRIAIDFSSSTITKAYLSNFTTRDCAVGYLGGWAISV